MATFLTAVIYVGPAVLLLGLLVVTVCLVLALRHPERSRVLHMALVSAGLGLAGFLVGTMVGIAFFCSTASTGNLCGLGGVFGTGPFAAGLCMSVYAIRRTMVRRVAP